MLVAEPPDLPEEGRVRRVHTTLTLHGLNKHRRGVVVDQGSEGLNVVELAETAIVGNDLVSEIPGEKNG